MWRAALCRRDALGAVLAGLIYTGINTRKSNDGAAARETTHITDFSHKLCGSRLTHAVHGTHGSFHFMTPVGYVDLTAQDAEQLRQGAAMPAHAGESGWEIPIPTEKLLQQELVTARKTENGQWYAITTDPQPEMAEAEQMQEMQL